MYRPGTDGKSFEKVYQEKHLSRIQYDLRIKFSL